MTQGQPEDQLDLDAYFERIGYDGERTPTLATLQAIHLRHASTIPFENLTPFLRQPVRLDLASLQHKLVQSGRGGYCFEQNLLLHAVLRALGFQVTGLAARVRWVVDRLDDIPEIPRDPELVRTIKELAPQLADSMDYQRRGPYTLIHHDYHLGNLIFVETNDSPNVIVIDWQDLSVGHGPTDIAMLLGYSFSIEDRSKHEQKLLKLYYDTLCEHGVANYSFDQCWDDYRLGMFEILWRNVILFGNRYLQGAAYTEHLEVTGPRSYAAVVDLKSREALSRLAV